MPGQTGYCWRLQSHSHPGMHAAVIAGHLLKAELAVSAGGRFPSNRKQPLRILSMIFTIWRVMHKGRCPRVLVSCAADKSRDRKFAKIMTRLFGNNPDIVTLPNEKVGHNVLGRMVERGELGPYLARTIFAEINDELIPTGREVLGGIKMRASAKTGVLEN
jgi:hypothetical protein